MTYAKTLKAKATVGEARALALNASTPARVAARFALIVSLASFVIAVAALIVAVVK